jgi:hypothetical protein
MEAGSLVPSSIATRALGTMIADNVAVLPYRGSVGVLFERSQPGCLLLVMTSVWVKSSVFGRSEKLGSNEILFGARLSPYGRPL